MKPNSERKAHGRLGAAPLLGDWRDISTAPKDGTRFIGRVQSPNKTSENKRQTWWGKTSHVPLYGWCHGRVENVDLWQPTHWKPIKAKSPNDPKLSDSPARRDPCVEGGKAEEGSTGHDAQASSLQRMVRRRWMTLSELHAEIGRMLQMPEAGAMPTYVKAGDELRELGSVIMWASRPPNGSGLGWVCLGEIRKPNLVRLRPTDLHQARMEEMPPPPAASTRANTDE